MGIMIFMLKSQRRVFRWPNNFRARLYTDINAYKLHSCMTTVFISCVVNCKY